MAHTTNANKGIAGSVVVIFLAIMTAAWLVYSVLFPHDVLTFFVMLIYFAIVGIAAALLYRHLRVTPD